MHPIHQNCTFLDDAPAGSSSDPIAIVGMAIRAPGGVENPEDLWNFLLEKRSGSCRVPKSRYNVDGFHSPVPKHGTVQTTEGYFLDAVSLDRFDVSHFTFSRQEVEQMDPCQRQLLEIAWECLESAGETDWRGKNIGCYVGAFGEDWLQDDVLDTHHTGIYRVGGMSDFILSNRVSYAFDLHGPSTTVKTGCSSTLVALDMAAEALRRGECCSALVMGCNLILSPLMTIAYTEQGILSPTGRCRTFDAASDGYGRGEAVNALFVKRASDALRDGNPIRAILRASATQHDGKKSGLSNPSSYSQEALIRHTYQVAGIEDYSKTAFFECHGTGTPVGDPAEVGAVARVFGESGIVIGAIKPNVGHSEGAAGLTSAIKAILALEKKTIPPNIYFDRPNPRIPWKAARLSVPTEPLEWPQGRAGRISVNSFGVGGTNAHIILESAYESNSEIKRSHSLGPHLLCFSASNMASLEKHFDRYAKYMYEKLPDLANLAYTLNCRRERLGFRGYAVTDDPKKLPTSVARAANTKPPKVIFMFTGQGAQWPGMAEVLVQTNPAFRATIKRLDQALARLSEPPPWTLLEELGRPKQESRVTQAAFSFPCTAALQIGLVDVLRSWGLNFDAVIGHSSGEIAAAYASGAITADSAIAIAFYRGHVLMNGRDGSTGSMAVVSIGPDEVAPFLLPSVGIACENSQSSTTISGDADKVKDVIANVLRQRPGTLTRQLQVDHAYHSFHMQHYAGAYRAAIAPLCDPNTTTIPIFSSVTGDAISGDLLNAEHWQRSLASPVLFNQAMRKLLVYSGDQSPTVVVEIGSHPALKSPLNQIVKDVHHADVHHVSTLIRHENPSVSILKTAGTLFTENVDVHMEVISPPGRILTDLPTYPWYHEDVYWDEPRAARAYKQRSHPRHDLLGARITEGNDIEPSWRNVLDVRACSWLQDHVISGEVVFPAAGYISMAVEAVWQVTGTEPASYTLRDVSIASGLLLKTAKKVELQTRLRPLSPPNSNCPPRYHLQILSFDGQSWTSHFSASISPFAEKAKAYEAPCEAQHYTRRIERKSWYKMADRMGLSYGSAFQRLYDIRASPVVMSAVARILDFDDDASSICPPIVLDQCFQLVLLASCQGLARKFDQTVVPISIQEMTVASSVKQATVHAVAERDRQGTIKGDVSILQADGSIVLRIRGLSTATLSADMPTKQKLLSYIDWHADPTFYDFSLERLANDLRDTLPWKLEQYLFLSLLTASRTSSAPNGAAGPLGGWLSQKIREAQMGCFGILSKRECAALLGDPRRQAGWTDLRDDLAQAGLAPICTKIEELLRGQIRSGIGSAIECLGEDSFRTSATAVLLRHIMRILAHKNPRLSVLEVGSRRTRFGECLAGLRTNEGEQLYRKYTFAAMSLEMLDEIESRQGDSQKAEVIQLDYDEEDGFEPCDFQYDVVLCTGIPPDVVSSETYIEHLRKVQRAGGWMVRLDRVPMSEWMDFCPVLPGNMLTGLEPMVHQSPGETNIIESTKITWNPSRVTLVAPHQDHALVGFVKDSLQGKGIHVESQPSLHGIPDDHDLISFMDLSEPSLYGLSEPRFESLVRTLTILGRLVIWVLPSLQTECSNPDSALMIGLARTLRMETKADITTLEIDSTDSNYSDCGRAVVELYGSLDERKLHEHLDPDREYALVEGILKVSRLRWAATRDELMAQSTNLVPEVTSSLQAWRPGHAKTLRWVAKPCTPISKDSLKIDVHYMSLPNTMSSFADDSAFSEGSGIVTAVGNEEQDFKVGDKVMFLSFAEASRLMVLPATSCVRLSPEMHLATAASLLNTYGSAQLTTTGINPGDRVLVSSPCTSIGQAVIKSCQDAHADTFAIVESSAQRALLSQHGCVPEDRILEVNNDTLPSIMTITGGTGFDYIVDTVNALDEEILLGALSVCGTLIELNAGVMRKADQTSRKTLRGNQSVRKMDLLQLSRAYPVKFSRIARRCLHLMSNNNADFLQPLRILGAEEVARAWKPEAGEGDFFGRTVVAMLKDHNSAEIRFVPRFDSLYFKPDVCYILVGGLGGLGRAIASWMVGQGARHILFFSRSARSDSGDEPFFEELASQGCAVQTFSGSVTSFKDVANAVKLVSRPIAGVMLMSAVLRDNAIFRMTLNEWNDSVSPKFHGAWNLHRALLCENLDFFILFSSISGIVGQPGQANYNAANTFLDAFARYRVGLGMPASVIDIGVMGDVGMVSEDEGLLKKFQRSGTTFVRESDLLDALTVAISSSSSVQRGEMTNRHQIILGLCPSQDAPDSAARVPWRKDPRMSKWLDMGSTHGPRTTARSKGAAAVLELAANEPEKLKEASTIQLIATQVGHALCDLLMRPTEELRPTVSPQDMGLDSLVAIELRSWISQEFAVDVPVLQLVQSPSLSHLGKAISELLIR